MEKPPESLSASEFLNVRPRDVNMLEPVERLVLDSAGKVTDK